MTRVCDRNYEGQVGVELLNQLFDTSKGRYKENPLRTVLSSSSVESFGNSHSLLGLPRAKADFRVPSIDGSFSSISVNASSETNISSS